MLKKLKSRAGLTLTELMVTMLLLTMFSSACLIGITSAFASRRDHIRIADADILKSTVTEVITQELRLGTRPKAHGEDDGAGTTTGKIIEYGGGLSIDGKTNDIVYLTTYNGRLQKIYRLTTKDTKVEEGEKTSEEKIDKLMSDIDSFSGDTQSLIDTIFTDNDYKAYKKYQVLNNAAYGDDSSFGDKEYDEMGFFRIEDLSFTVDGDVISVSFDIVGKDDLKYTEADFDVVPLNTITTE